MKIVLIIPILFSSISFGLYNSCTATATCTKSTATCSTDINTGVENIRTSCGPHGKFLQCMQKGTYQGQPLGDVRFVCCGADGNALLFHKITEAQKDCVNF